jgi:transcriptional regulator with XRE-family HTH domain
MKKSDFSLTTFGMRVREHRQSRGLTIRDFSSSLNVEPFEIAQMETGEREVDLRYVERVCDYLSLNLAERLELIKLASGRRNSHAQAFYRSRQALHLHAGRALQRMHEWRPAVIRRIGEYVGQHWRPT